ncbi:MAG: dihydrolipoyllysine-residue succinyltransferase [Bacillus sp. (in: firmicutes)]
MAEIKVPELAESITEGTVARWLKVPGDTIHKGDYVVELETDKVNVEIISEYDGVLETVKYLEGDTVKVGETIATLIVEGTVSAEKNKEKEDIASEDEQVNTPSNTRIIASPAARKIAREKGIDLNRVQTMDPFGRVRSQDLTENEVDTRNASTKNASTNRDEKAMKWLNEPLQENAIDRIKMTRRRRTIASKLVEVQKTAAMLTTFNEIDMTNVINLRKRRSDHFYQEHDVKLGFMSFFTKATVAALKRIPMLNAEIQDDEIVIKRYYDIGIAVAANEGLVVPVVRNADCKNFAEIEKDIFELAEKSRQNKLAIKELQGGTFTITNGGVFGSLLSTPILNGPQVGILGMHSIQWRPVAIDEERIENRPMMYVALSYDHRIVDGKEAVIFLKHIKTLIEDPESLLFEI